MYNPIYLFVLGNDPFTFISLILFSLMMSSLMVYCFLTQKTTYKSYREQIDLLEARSLAA